MFEAGQRVVIEGITEDRTAEEACSSIGPEAATLFIWQV